MILSTTENLPDRRIVRVLGICKGCSVRGTHVGGDLVAQMKNKLGGEVHEYTQVFAAAREQAMDRMIEDARRLGANAVVGVKFCSTEIGAGVAELMCYGTAVQTQNSTPES